MAYALVSRSFHCICGKGRIVNEWMQPDLWPHEHSGGGVWHIECPVCANDYSFGLDFIVRRSDGEMTPLRFLSRVVAATPKE